MKFKFNGSMEEFWFFRWRIGALAAPQNERIVRMYEDLKEKVEKLTSASDAAEALLNGIKAKLDAVIAQLPNAADKARLQAVSDAIGKETEDLAAAVVANTPAEEPPTQ